jgi:hypothetical protein
MILGHLRADLLAMSKGKQTQRDESSSRKHDATFLPSERGCAANHGIEAYQ